MRRILICLLALLLLLPAGCSMNPSENAPELREPAGMAVDNTPVIRGDIYNVETCEGLVLPKVHELAFPAGGIVDEVMVCVGSQVKAGDTLACLDAKMFEASLAAAKEELEYNEQVWKLSEEMAQTQIQIARVELRQLKESGAAESERKLKEIAIAELENQLKADKALWELSRTESEQRIAGLEKQVAGSVLTAPCDGTVVYTSGAEGSYALANVGLFWVAEDDNLYISGEYVSADQVNKALRVYATVAGKQVEVSYEPMDRAEFISRNDSDEELTSTFHITDAGDATIESGMSAVVFLVTECAEDVLTIPSCALRQDSAGDFVYLVQEDGAQVRRSVKRGIYNNAYVEIVEGLEEGDIVYAGN